MGGGGGEGKERPAALDVVHLKIIKWAFERASSVRWFLALLTKGQEGDLGSDLFWF